MKKKEDEAVKVEIKAGRHVKKQLPLRQ